MTQSRAVLNPLDRRRTVAVREARRRALIPLMPAHDEPSNAEYRDVNPPPAVGEGR
ncbi:hypothetical protein ACFVY1_32890 [Streptomyces sp. NPDC058293]|uniref:hypothetical protein n=1 Tax=Streptomyces sp. NPDC058293 TaxID=3346429 RepID=UPI0036ED8071